MQNYLSEKEAKNSAEKIQKILVEINSAIFGQENIIELTICGILARGHILIEGMPGLGKTQLVKTISKTIQLSYNRIQFTPDLLPADITGTPMLQDINNEKKFIFQKGPIFTNLLLADEINRASPKTQSALLEAMAEKQSTVMGKTYHLNDPFFVIATQNPIDLEGTYPLPEAQIDRFLFKLNIHSNDTKILEKIVKLHGTQQEKITQQIITIYEIKTLIENTKKIYLPDVVTNYIARIVNATHNHKKIAHGASPRAAIALASASKARALIHGRINAIYDDIKEIAIPILAHRIILDYDATLNNTSPKSIIKEIIKNTPETDTQMPKTLSN